MNVRSRLKALRLDRRGTTAVEFAIIAPVFIALLVGTISVSVGLFLIGSLHYAVEEGARCASVKTACQVNGSADANATIAYAQSRYFGPNVSPTFTYAAAACGNSVSASINYSLDVGLRTFHRPHFCQGLFPLKSPGFHFFRIMLSSLCSSMIFRKTGFHFSGSCSSGAGHIPCRFCFALTCL